MNNSTIGWIIGLGIALLLFPGFNLIAAVLLAFGIGTASERVIGSPSKYKELR